MENEIWVDVLDYEGLYQVSNLGRVKSFKFGKEKILKQVIISRGYYAVTLCKNAKCKMFTVHRLVYETFNGKTDLQIDHIQERNKKDNRLCNLQAITQRQNISKYRLTINKSSKYTGVHWNKNINKWQSTIYINGKSMHLGLFLTELEAHQAYQNELQHLKVAELTIGV